MATLPFGLTKVIVGFSDLFSKRAWPQVQVMLAGAIAAVGPRTVATVLRVMGMADKIKRRRGAKISAKGIYRHPVRSSHSHFVKASNLLWLCLVFLAPIPWARHHWALPFCSVLAPSERYYLDHHRRPNKLTDRARQLLLMVKHWPPNRFRSIVVVADSSFAALKPLAAVCDTVCIVTRLGLDAAL